MNPNTDSAALPGLIEKCVNLCANADSAISEMEPERETFLKTNLESSLQQLELILRALSEGGANAPKGEERAGFLSKIFAGNDSVNKPGAEAFEPPRFDVSHQGLQGNSWTVSLSEILGFLAYGRKTGVLWVDSPEENFLIGLVDGNLMHATSDRTPAGQRLGEVLVQLGFLTHTQLERFLDQRADGEKSIAGEILLANGLISHDELHESLAYQVQQLFHRVVNTSNAVFRFREGMEIALAYQVNLNINSLLLESARVQDETQNKEPGADVLHQYLNSWPEDLASEFPKTGKPASPEVAQTVETGKAPEPATQAEANSDSNSTAPQASKGSDSSESPAGEAVAENGNDGPDNNDNSNQKGRGRRNKRNRK